MIENSTEIRDWGQEGGGVGEEKAEDYPWESL